MKNLISKIKDNRLIMISIIAVITIIAIISCKEKSETVKPVRKNIIDAVFASGFTINSDEYIVATKTEGFILKSYVKEGDEVEVGDLLFQLSGDVQSSQLDNALAQYNDALLKASPESPQLISYKTQIKQSQSQIELDKKNYERYSELIKTNAISKLDFEKAKLQYEASLSELEVLEKTLEDYNNSVRLNLENAESQLKIQKEYYGDYFIKASKKGKVLNIFKEQGELAKKENHLPRLEAAKQLLNFLLLKKILIILKLDKVQRSL
jgi:macrolide-specific efflux system membrane fusion protein